VPRVLKAAAAADCGPQRQERPGRQGARLSSLASAPARGSREARGLLCQADTGGSLLGQAELVEQELRHAIALRQALSLADQVRAGACSPPRPRPAASPFLTPTSRQGGILGRPVSCQESQRRQRRRASGVAGRQLWCRAACPRSGLHGSAVSLHGRPGAQPVPAFKTNMHCVLFV